MEKINADEVYKLMSYGRIPVFKKEIEELKQGEALKLLKSEWEFKTPPTAYYCAKMKGVVKVRTVGEFFYIIKL